MLPPPPRSTLFPYTTLFRSIERHHGHPVARREAGHPGTDGGDRPGHLVAEDRKSTRLNSSHVRTSYAVFCLKKKKRSDQCNSTPIPPYPTSHSMPSSTTSRS